MSTGKLSVVLVTAGTADEARNIAEHLVRERLAACVNILGPIRSVYMWEEKLHNEPEYLLVIKAAKENFTALEQAVRERHSYTVPEIVALEVTEGFQPYLEWALAARPGSRSQ